MTKFAAKKIKLTFSIFSTTIFITQFPPIAIAGSSNSQYCIFVQHFWELKIFKTVWRRRNITNSRVLRLWWRSGWRKLRPKKNWRLRSWSAFLWCLPTLSQTGWWSRLASFDAIKLPGLSSTPGLLSWPLGKVSPPIWPGDLQCGCASIHQYFSSIGNLILTWKVLIPLIHRNYWYLNSIEYHYFEVSKVSMFQASKSINW